MAIAAIASLILLTWSGTKPVSLAITSGWLITTLVSAHFAWRKQPIPSAAALCTGLALVTGSSALLSSVHSLGFVGNVVVMALVVPLFGTRWGWAIAAWTLLTGGVWLALEKLGVSAPYRIAGDLQAYLFTSMLVLLMLAVTALPARLLWQALQSAESRLRALEAARKDEQRAATALHLANEQLAHARRLDALGKLAGGVAHDFNNMLSAIVGATELISARTRHTRSPELDEHIALLRAATERAAELTRKLLAFGRKSHFSAERYDVAELIATVTTLVRPGLGRNVALTVHLPDRPLTVWGDPSELEHALLNLVLNARDALQEKAEGKIAITGRLITLEAPWCEASSFDIKPGQAVQLSIEDNGTGMTPEVQARAFEPFFTTKAYERGTGLGLSAVHGTVVSHKGAIEVDSEPGVGTVFNVYLPLSAENKEELQPSASPQPERHSITRARGNTVVVVDDNALNLRAVSGLVRQLGYECEALPKADAVLRYLAEPNDVVAVISDVVMPEMDGVALAQAIAERHPQIPVVLMSGFAPEGVLASLTEARATRVLRKPFRREELEDALHDAAGGRRVSDAAQHEEARRQ